MLQLICFLMALATATAPHAVAQTPDLNRGALESLSRQPCYGFLTVSYTNHPGRAAKIGYILNANSVPTHLCFSDPGAEKNSEKFKAYTLSRLNVRQTLKGRGEKIAAQLQYSGSTLTFWYTDDARNEKPPAQSRSFRIDYDGKTRTYIATDTSTRKRAKLILIQPTEANYLGYEVEVGIRQLSVQ